MAVYLVLALASVITLTVAAWCIYGVLCEDLTEVFAESRSARGKKKYLADELTSHGFDLVAFVTLAALSVVGIAWSSARICPL